MRILAQERPNRDDPKDAFLLYSVSLELPNARDNRQFASFWCNRQNSNRTIGDSSLSTERKATYNEVSRVRYYI